MGTLELELGIGLAYSLTNMSILILHLGIGIGYWIGSKFIQHMCLLSINKSDMGSLELGLGIGLAHSLASVVILMPHLRIGIGNWIGSKIIQHVCLSKI